MNITRWTVTPATFLAQRLVWALLAHADAACRTATRAYVEAK